MLQGHSPLLLRGVGRRWGRGGATLIDTAVPPALGGPFPTLGPLPMTRPPALLPRPCQERHVTLHAGPAPCLVYCSSSQGRRPGGACRPPPHGNRTQQTPKPEFQAQKGAGSPNSQLTLLAGQCDSTVLTVIPTLQSTSRGRPMPAPPGEGQASSPWAWGPWLPF